jgi:hypothetical protein
MALRTLKHEIINHIDINNLLTRFKICEVAMILNVPEDYIIKTRNLQKIEAEESFNSNVYSDSDEMKIGRVGAWMDSKERKIIQLIKKQEI